MEAKFIFQGNSVLRVVPNADSVPMYEIRDFSSGMTKQRALCDPESLRVDVLMKKKLLGPTWKWAVFKSGTEKLFTLKRPILHGDMVVETKSGIRWTVKGSWLAKNLAVFEGHRGGIATMCKGADEDSFGVKVLRQGHDDIIVPLYALLKKICSSPGQNSTRSHLLCGVNTAAGVGHLLGCVSDIITLANN